MGDVRLYVWRHGTLSMDDHYSTIEAAIKAAVSISDYGSGAPHGVEVGGEWVTPEDERWKTIERAEWAAQDARYAEQPKMTHMLEVQAPDGAWAQYSGYPSFDDAKATAAGFDHARIRKVGPGWKYIWNSSQAAGETGDA